MLPPNPPKLSHRDFDPSLPDPNDDVDMANGDDDDASSLELNSVEINILIYLYLLESNFHHTAFTLLSESSLPSTALFQHFNPSYPPANGKPVSAKKDQVNGVATPAAGKGPSPVQASFGRSEGKIERGELVRKLWKSLRWEEIERHITPTGEQYKPTCPNAFNLIIPHVCPPGYPSAIGNPRTPFPANLRKPSASSPRHRPEVFPPPDESAAGPSRTREIRLNDDEDETDSDPVAPRRGKERAKGKKGKKGPSRRTSDDETDDAGSRRRSASPPRRKPGRPARNAEPGDDGDARKRAKSPDKKTRRDGRSTRWERDNASVKRSESRDDSPASTVDARKRKRGDLLAPLDNSDARSARSSRSPKPPPPPLDEEMEEEEEIEEVEHKSHNNPRWFTDSEIGIFPDHSQMVAQIAWNPSNPSVLATGSVDGTCKWFDLTLEEGSNRLVSANKPLVLKHIGINSTQKGITDVSFHPEGTLLLTDGVGRLFTPSGTLLSIMSFGRLSMSGAQFNPAGDRVISAKHDGTVILWKPGADNNSNLIHIYSNHTKEVSVIAWLDDRVFASGGYDHLIIIQRTSDQAPRYVFKGHTDDITHLDWQPPIPGKATHERLLASVADDGYLRIWKLPEYPSDQRPMSRSASPLKSGSEHGDGKAKTPFGAGGEHCISSIQVIDGDSTRMSALKWSPAATEERAWVAASAQETGVQLYDALTGEHIRSFEGFEGGTSTFCFSPLTLGKNGLGCVAAGGWNGQICIWDVETGDLLKEYQIEHAKKESPIVMRMEWRKDGVQLAVGSGGKGKTLMTFYTGDLLSTSPRWSEDAKAEE